VAALGHIAVEEGDLVYAELYYSPAVNLGLDVRFEVAQVMVRLGKTAPARSRLGQLAKENRPDAINEFGLFVAVAENRFSATATVGGFPSNPRVEEFRKTTSSTNSRAHSGAGDLAETEPQSSIPPLKRTRR